MEQQPAVGGRLLPVAVGSRPELLRARGARNQMRSKHASSIADVQLAAELQAGDMGVIETESKNAISARKA